MLSRFSPTRTAVFVALIALMTGAARAADTGNGSKNFATPQTVPNYFSNEAGPMQGPASETQRGPLYMGQTYGGMPPARQPAVATVTARAPVAVAAPVYYRQHVAMAEPRGRVIRGRRGRTVVARHIAVHGRSVVHVASHGSSHGRAHVAVAHSVSSKGGRVVSSHRRARG